MQWVLEMDDSNSNAETRETKTKNVHIITQSPLYLFKLVRRTHHTLPINSITKKIQHKLVFFPKGYSPAETQPEQWSRDCKEICRLSCRDVNWMITVNAITLGSPLSQYSLSNFATSVCKCNLETAV